MFAFLCMAVLLGGCASEKMLKASHKTIPVWVNELPRSQGDILYFYGVGKAGEQNEAERMAHSAAATRISESLIVVMRSVYNENVKSDPTKESVAIESMSKSLTNNILQGMLLSDSYWELWRRGDEKYIVFHGRIGIPSHEYERLRNETKNRLLQEQATIKAAEDLFRDGKYQEVANKLYPLIGSGLQVNEIFPLVYKSYTELKSHQKALELVEKGVQFGVWSEQEAQFMRETQEVAVIDQIETQVTQIEESVRNTEHLLRACHSRSAFERAVAVYGRLKAKAIFEETAKNGTPNSKTHMVGFFSGEGEALNPTDSFSITLTDCFAQDKRTAVVESDVLRRDMENKGYKRLNIARLQEIVRQERVKGIYVVHSGNCYYIQKTDSDNFVTAKGVFIPSSADWERRNSEDIFNVKELQFFGCVACNNSGKCNTCRGSGFEKCSTCYGTHKIRNEVMCADCAGKGSFADQKRCATCGGSGGPWRQCATCAGSGTVAFFGVPINCSTCGGAGKYGCTTCKGQGNVPYDRQCTVCNGSGKKYWYETCANCDTNGRVKCHDCSGKTTCNYCVK